MRWPHISPEQSDIILFRWNVWVHWNIFSNVKTVVWRLLVSLCGPVDNISEGYLNNVMTASNWYCCQKSLSKHTECNGTMLKLKNMTPISAGKQWTAFSVSQLVYYHSLLTQHFNHKMLDIVCIVPFLYTHDWNCLFLCAIDLDCCPKTHINEWHCFTGWHVQPVQHYNKDEHCSLFWVDSSAGKLNFIMYTQLHGHPFLLTTTPLIRPFNQLKNQA